ncbi:MAG TPA: DnaB-like helicase C-terminal domain-containing protein [Acidimicrobiales bacterium]|nr:DnaB-like helicase C-terminal domain-containing protein [Acidimicrobiales bacterium]
MMSPPVRTAADDGSAIGRSARTTLVDLQATELEIPRPTPFGTGFSPLDGVLNGGIRAGDLLLIGGKPGQGKTIAALQWARHMALTGHTAVFACYEHDEITVLIRLLACELGEVIAEAGAVDEIRLDRLRAGLRAVSTGTARVREVLDSDVMLLDAEARLRVYAEKLILLRASGTRTDLPALARLVDECGGERTALFVDYLQKVPVRPEPPEEAERVKRVAEGLKELALGARIAVVAVAAADRLGLTSKRLRLHHMRGSTALAYEADAAVVLNDKIAVVAKAHLAYDTTRSEEFRRRVVFSVEKNRNGPSDVELEFEKDFANFRFNPVGRWVAERLWHEGAVDE